MNSIPATIGSAVFKRAKTGRMSPTSVQACKLRTLFRRMAMNMLQISALKKNSENSYMNNFAII